VYSVAPKPPSRMPECACCDDGPATAVSGVRGDSSIVDRMSISTGKRLLVRLGRTCSHSSCHCCAPVHGYCGGERTCMDMCKMEGCGAHLSMAAAILLVAMVNRALRRHRHAGSVNFTRAYRARELADHAFHHLATLLRRPKHTLPHLLHVVF
jgi:hypothetical protein